jgi:hypothetical protein
MQDLGKKYVLNKLYFLDKHARIPSKKKIISLIFWRNRRLIQSESWRERDD